MRPCPCRGSSTSRCQWRLGVRSACVETRKEGPRYQTCFSVVHVGCSIAGIDVIARGPWEKRTYACVGCTLAMTVNRGLVETGHETQTNLQAFRYAVNLAAERPVRVLYADAMRSRPLLACSKYLQRRRAQPHLRGLQRHECSTRQPHSSQFSLSQTE